MRMWMVAPEVLCRKHLLGEHVECHMLIGSLRLKRSVKKYVEYGLIDTSKVQERHDALAIEIERRGYNHKSPLIIDFPLVFVGTVDVENSYKELSTRCAVCAENIKHYKEAKNG